VKRGARGTDRRQERYIQGFGENTGEGKSPLRKHTPRWEDSIKMDIKEVVWRVMDWLVLPQDRDC
jgi:hypothetical protein